MSKQEAVAFKFRNATNDAADKSLTVAGSAPTVRDAVGVGAPHLDFARHSVRIREPDGSVYSYTPTKGAVPGKVLDLDRVLVPGTLITIAPAQFVGAPAART